MIENPEAHLHPSGQTALGRLIALGSKCGVQFLIETQSDHLMDGIRIAVKQGKVSPEEVAFHYLKKGLSGETEIDTPTINTNGKLSHWPEGFFDQTLKNRAFLAR
jgi:predicted ATPase